MEFIPYCRGGAGEVLVAFYSPVWTGLLLAQCFTTHLQVLVKKVSRWVFCFDGGSLRSGEGKYRDNPHTSVD